MQLGEALAQSLDERVTVNTAGDPNRNRKTGGTSPTGRGKRHPVPRYKSSSPSAKSWTVRRSRSHDATQARATYLGLSIGRRTGRRGGQLAVGPAATKNGAETPSRKFERLCRLEDWDSKRLATSSYGVASLRTRRGCTSAQALTPLKYVGFSFVF